MHSRRNKKLTTERFFYNQQCHGPRGITEAFPSHANTLFHEQNTSQFEVRDSPMVNSGIGTGKLANDFV